MTVRVMCVLAVVMCGCGCAHREGCAGACVVFVSVWRVVCSVGVRAWVLLLRVGCPSVCV